MTERMKTALAVELAGILALQHGVVEHHSSTDEIDAVLGDILLAARLLPLGHWTLTRQPGLLLCGGGGLGWQARRGLTALAIPPTPPLPHSTR